MPRSSQQQRGQQQTQRARVHVTGAKRWSQNFGPVVKLEHLMKDEQYDDTQTLFG